jgi:hypothetical protein
LDSQENRYSYEEKEQKGMFEFRVKIYFPHTKLLFRYNEGRD